MDETSLHFIQNLFEQYYIHPDCKTEIYNLVVKNNRIKLFYSLFEKNTNYLKQLGPEVFQTNNFEILKESSNLYAMRFKKKDFNLRIIYTNKSGKLALLLCCFYERSDSKETYKKYIPIAEKRLIDMEEEDG